ncbi:MAG: hypothetical protein PW791_14305 [Neorhizobium sp.]|nr:hypothetical protein [Neorhizobium sp.]
MKPLSADDVAREIAICGWREAGHGVDAACMTGGAALPRPLPAFQPPAGLPEAAGHSDLRP